MKKLFSVFVMKILALAAMLTFAARISIDKIGQLLPEYADLSRNAIGIAWLVILVILVMAPLFKYFGYGPPSKLPKDPKQE
jgi:hypothetical protein